jgi:tetratricopeptide (TPR) repeat protein
MGRKGFYMSKKSFFIIVGVSLVVLVAVFGGAWARHSWKQRQMEKAAATMQSETEQKIKAANPVLYERLQSNLKEAQQTLAEKPEDYNANLALAVSYDRLGNKLKAEELYKKLVTINPVGAVPWNNLAQLYQDQGRYAEAEQAWQGYINNFGGDVDGYLGLARLYATGKVGDKTKAVQVLEQGVQKVADPTGLKQAIERVRQGEMP